MRPFISIAAAFLCLSSSARAEDCAWTEPKSPPVFEVKEGVATFSWAQDREWFRCARADGASKLTVTWLLGGRRGELEPAKTSEPRNASVRESIFRSWFCKQPRLPHRVQVKVEGTGAFARLAHETEVKPIHCDRCERRPYEESMAIHVGSAVTKKGHVTIEGGYDDAFRTCAMNDPEDPASLELRVYVGRTEAEARRRTDHSFVVRGLEKSAKFREPLPLKELCAGGDTWVGVELFGTGELAQINGAGRSARELKCP